MQLTDLNTWVDERKPAIETALRELVELNTFSDNVEGVDAGMDLLSRIANELGFTVEVINARNRLIKAGNGTGPRVLLISHIDTVHPPDGAFQHYEVLPDGYVRGPGVGDIKGGMVIGLWAMRALCDMLGDCDLQMVVSADEEKGSPNIRDWYMAGHVGAAYGIGLEPGFPQGPLSPTVNLGVVYQRRGFGSITFTVKGEEAHSGTPDLGLNALEAMAKRVVALGDLNDWDNGVSVNVGILHGGIAHNTVPGEATCTVSFRYETLADGEATRDKAIEIIEGQYLYSEHLDRWDEAEWELKVFIPPMERSDANQKLVDIVVGEAERLKQNVVPIARGGGSDANYISGSGTPTICGMGAPAHGIHTDEEMIYLPGLFERVNLLASTLYRIYEHRP